MPRTLTPNQLLWVLSDVDVVGYNHYLGYYYRAYDLTTHRPADPSEVPELLQGNSLSAVIDMWDNEEDTNNTYSWHDLAYGSWTFYYTDDNTEVDLDDEDEGWLAPPGCVQYLPGVSSVYRDWDQIRRDTRYNPTAILYRYGNNAIHLDFVHGSHPHCDTRTGVPIQYRVTNNQLECRANSSDVWRPIRTVLRSHHRWAFAEDVEPYRIGPQEAEMRPIERDYSAPLQHNNPEPFPITPYRPLSVLSEIETRTNQG